MLLIFSYTVFSKCDPSSQQTYYKGCTGFINNQALSVVVFCSDSSTYFQVLKRKTQGQGCILVELIIKQGIELCLAAGLWLTGLCYKLSHVKAPMVSDLLHRHALDQNHVIWVLCHHVLFKYLRLLIFSSENLEQVYIQLCLEQCVAGATHHNVKQKQKVSSIFFSREIMQYSKKTF